MTDPTSKKPFALDAGRTSFGMNDLKPQIRDQDNAAPRPAPPQIFRLDNPRLAPPGMKGITATFRPNQNIDININLNVRLDQPKPFKRPPPPSAKPRLELGDGGNVRREYKSLSSNLGRERSR